MALEISGVHKRYGAVRANDGVSFTVQPGALHGLVGENGAGKSTLVGILAGSRHADSGTITLDGTQLRLRGPRDGLAAGIGLLHQDPMVLGPLTVLENFLLGRRRGLRLARRDGRARLEAMAERLGFALPPDAIARSLTVGERQQLEIARLLDAGARVLILDEPTTAISTDQRVALFAVLRQLAHDEGLSVLYVTHKLEELAELCDRVTVMRAGKVVGEEDLPVPPGRLVELMFGAPPAGASRVGTGEAGEPLLSLRNVSAADGASRIRAVDLDLRAGEVVGLAGMEGSGQRAILRVAAGVVQATEGAVLTDPSSTQESTVEFLPADRLAEGLVPGLTLAEHAELAGAVPPRPGWRRFFVDGAAGEEAAARAIAEYSIKATPRSMPEQLSGGNQQRLLLSLIRPEARVLLLDQPTRGLDIASAEWVWEQLAARVSRGAAIVFASADLDELRERADRVLVCFAGEVIAELPAAEATTDALGHLIGGRRV